MTRLIAEDGSCITLFLMRPDQQLAKRHLTVKWASVVVLYRCPYLPGGLANGSIPVGIKNVLVHKEKPCEIQKYINIIVSSSDKVTSIAVANYFSPFWVIQYCWIWLRSLLEIIKIIRLQVGFLAGDGHLFIFFNLEVKGKICFTCLYFFPKVENGGRCWVCMLPACNYLHVCLRGLGLL